MKQIIGGIVIVGGLIVAGLMAGGALLQFVTTELNHHFGLPILEEISLFESARLFGAIVLLAFLIRPGVGSDA